MSMTPAYQMNPESYTPPTVKPIPSTAPEGTIRCDEGCHGTGVKTWGGTVNGVPLKSGKCFRCGGKGHQTPEDQKRNANYDRYAISRAMNY